MRGARLHYAVPRLLHRNGMLAALVTDAYAGSALWRAVLRLGARLPGVGPLMAAAAGRYHPELADARIVSRQASGLSNVLQRRKAATRSTRRGVKFDAAQGLGTLYAALPSLPAEVIFAHAGAALEPFEVGAERGALRVLDQSIAARPFVADLMSAEVAAHGHMVMPGAVPPPTVGDDSRSRQEWEQADAILCASEFVLQSMVHSGVPAAKCHLVPFGVTLPATPPRLPDYDGQRPLRLLFAGHVGLRKGVPHLLAALQALDGREVELRCAGTVELRPDVVAALPPHVRLLGRVPRAEMAALYHWADAFVLPSIAEGSAIVVYEALSFGLPVITTFNAGSVIEDGVEGRIIPASDPVALSAAILAYCDDPALLKRHAAGARAAEDKISFERYERDLLKVLNGISGQASPVSASRSDG